MAPSRTKTVKNKHAANKSGIKGSKLSKAGPADGIVKKRKGSGGGPPSKVKGKSLASVLGKKKRRVYTEKELDIPKLNMITPVGVEKPKGGKKKGKVFVDDTESMNTILAIVQADKEGEIESKMIKARQMEEIREARRVEAEKKDEERRSKLDDTKDSLKKKRSRTRPSQSESIGVKDVTNTSTKATKPKKKRVSFA